MENGSSFQSNKYLKIVKNNLRILGNIREIKILKYLLIIGIYLISIRFY